MSGWMEVYYTAQVRSNPHTPACWSTVYHNIFLRVQIERTVSGSDTGLVQALDTVAMLVHVAFRPVE